MKQAFERVKPNVLLDERKKRGLRLQFDPSVKLEFHGARISNDAGLLLFRELDEVLGLTGLAGSFLQDSRVVANPGVEPRDNDRLAAPGRIRTLGGL